MQVFLKSDYLFVVFSTDHTVAPGVGIALKFEISCLLTLLIWFFYVFFPLLMQVRICREKTTGHVYAMKKLKKSEMLRRGQVSPSSCFYLVYLCFFVRVC